MTDVEKLNKEQSILNKNQTYKLLKGRTGAIVPKDFTPSAIEGVNDLSDFLRTHGGYHQQERMIRDKRKSLDRALLYSYQGALIKKIGDFEEPIRALINPNKLKQDYDEKIVSVGFEHNFHSGDFFEWVNTNTYWLIYLQELTELAYFKSNIIFPSSSIQTPGLTSFNFFGVVPINNVKSSVFMLFLLYLLHLTFLIIYHKFLILHPCFLHEYLE